VTFDGRKQNGGFGRRFFCARLLPALPERHQENLAKYNRHKIVPKFGFDDFSGYATSFEVVVI
jgi:hypothetical protein